jgi:hypothetical protein
MKGIFTATILLVLICSGVHAQTLENLKRDHPVGFKLKFSRLERRADSIAIIKDRAERAEKQLHFQRRLYWLHKYSIPDKLLEDTAVIQFVGNGNIQKTFEEKDDVPSSTGIGVSYVEKWREPQFFDFYKIELDGFINIASNVDTVQGILDSSGKITNASEFGSSALTPLNSGQAISLTFRGYFLSAKLIFISGVRIKYNASNRVWNFNGESVQTTMNSIRIGGFHEFLKAEYRDDYSISLGISTAFNTIAGDLALDKNETFRASILNTKKTAYFGVEYSTVFRIKNIRAEFAYTVLPGMSVPGLSGGRLVTTISFVGGFPLKLN